MIRIPALAATVLWLAGCFVFDNPYDLSGPPPIPTVEFQIVVVGASYSGTYVWSPSDNAYTANLGTLFHVYMDSDGYWILSYLFNWNHTYGGVFGMSPVFGAQPPTNGTSWSPPGEIWSVDDSAGGICTLAAPDGPVHVGDTLKVTFKASDALNLATYQWERSSSPAWFSPVLIGTGSTHTLTLDDLNCWIRAIITPADAHGVVGSPASSPPVYIPN
jgi:hypothetical protein